MQVDNQDSLPGPNYTFEKPMLTKTCNEILHKLKNPVLDAKIAKIDQSMIYIITVVHQSISKIDDRDAVVSKLRDIGEASISLIVLDALNKSSGLRGAL